MHGGRLGSLPDRSGISSAGIINPEIVGVLTGNMVENAMFAKEGALAWGDTQPLVTGCLCRNTCRVIDK